MNPYHLLLGIAIAAAVFAALLWSIYRAVIVTGRLRINYTLLSLSTLLVVTGITWNLTMLTLTSAMSLAVTAVIAIIYEARWSKLLPLVQLVLGGLAFLSAIDVLLRLATSSALQNNL